MKKLLALLAVVALLIPVPSFAQEAPTPPAVQEAAQGAAEAAPEAPVNVDVTEVVVINTKYKEEAKLEGSYKIVAEAISKHLKGATFKIDKNTLFVGVQHDVLRADAELARIEFRSDCPDNSQYHVQPSVLAALGRDQMREILVAWTRHRHDALTADVRTVNVSNRGRNLLNFDVQLNLRKVALR